MSQLYISRSHVRRSLEWAALTRTLIILASAIAILIVVGLALPRTASSVILGVVALVGVPLFMSWIVTDVLCRRFVECPACKGSLWEIGTGGFMPRQMKIKDDVTSCPHCGAVLI
jgi:hypothetical protein